MAINHSTLSETELKMLEHIVVDIPTDFNIAQCSDCCIYEVPVNLRKVNEEAYTPQLIAIGPLHRNNSALKPMQREKARYFHFFWERSQCRHSNPQELLQGYKSKLEKEEEQIRGSYAKEFPEYSKEQFVEMIFLDAVFIMELFLRFWEKNDDYMITKSCLRKSILRDLLLSENQIPMFVLKELYDTVVAVAADKNQTHSAFYQLAGKFLVIYHPKKSDLLKEINKPTSDRTPSSGQLTASRHGSVLNASQKTKNSTKNWKESRHFTDMIRYFYLPDRILSGEKQNSLAEDQILSGEKQILPCEKQNSLPEDQILFDDKQNSPLPVLKTATQLNEAGVTLENVKNERLLDIKFKKERLSCFLCLSCLPKSRFFDCFKARLKIPQLKVDHSTDCLFRNLIALEQCHYPEEPYICNYVSLIDSLIHTKDDVELLVEKEVISHELGSHKELATIVNGLCKYVVVNETCYRDIIKELNDHHKKLWNRSMAALRLVYFRDPWRASSTVVAVAVLVFTIFNFSRIVRLVFELERN